MKLRVKYWNNDNSGCRCHTVEASETRPLQEQVKGLAKTIGEYFANVEIYDGDNCIMRSYTTKTA